ncbi:MAG: hypothetical protein KF836_02990 [Fimbriimonadaceae bacterium]|nr:hypothetical protein [Fimbriimonadaceae bacterium]
MKFRKLYWVTEQIDKDGSSSVMGVYTSIFDIRAKGIKWLEGQPKTEGFRVSLVKLDSAAEPLGSWASPGFEGMENDLHQFVATGEFDEPSCLQLVSDLRNFVANK